jgi:hypothetical protein
MCEIRNLENLKRNSLLVIGSAISLFMTLPVSVVLAGDIDSGANDLSNSKIRAGGASTLQKGISKV